MIKVIAGGVSFLLLLYGMVAFTYLETNPMKWDECQRSGFAIFVMATAMGTAFVIYIMNDKPKSK